MRLLARQVVGPPTTDPAAFWASAAGPILTPADLPKKIATTPMSGEWKANIADRWWSQACQTVPADIPDYERYRELQARLLAFGGEEVCLAHLDDDLADVMERGQAWTAKGSMTCKGDASRCHQNSLELWAANKDNPRTSVLCATGYGLSKDGMWRSHSWCVESRGGVGRVLETTVKRVLYYGFLMTPEMAEERWQEL